LGQSPARLPARLHRDEQGTISIVTVFAVLLLVMLLGMVMNVGRTVDDKIRMQNAADAAAYSGGVVIARGMNTLTFSNHLLFDVCALTALLREARDRNAEQYVPEILAAWDNVAPKFAGSGFPKFEALSQAIPQKVPLEQDLVTTFSDWGAAASALLLPTLEEILAQEMIPQFEQAVVWAYPEIAQQAVIECARRNGPAQNNRGEMLGAFWRTGGQLVGGTGEGFDRSLPVVDPVNDFLPNQATYMDRARQQRLRHAERYLGIRQRGWYYAGGWHAVSWNDELLWMFDHEAKMGRFASLWRGFTCGYLHELLEQEYPTSNLPMLIATEQDEIADTNAHLENHFTFLGVVYREELPQMFPGLFRNPADSDAVAYATTRVFIPQRRLVWHYASATSTPPLRSLGGMPGHPVDLPDDNSGSDDAEEAEGHWFVGRQSGVSEEWNLLNQHWTAKLVPTTQPFLAETLQTLPPLPEFAGQNIQLPNLGGLSTEEIGRISTH
jgi:hypothetical protein